MSDTRAEILDVAADLFVEQGYDQTSLREIAERVGVTKAALYYHFPSKEEILLTLLEPLGAVQEELLVTLDETDGADPEAWASALERLVDFLLENRRLFQLVERNLSAFVELSHRSEHYEKHLELHRRTDALMADERIPLAARVRCACALGVATALVEVGGAFAAEPTDAVRPVVVEAIRAVLRVPPAEVSDRAGGRAQPDVGRGR